MVYVRMMCTLTGQTGEQRCPCQPPVEGGRRMETGRDREGGYGRLRTGQYMRMSKSRGGGVMRRAASGLSARQGARYRR